MSIAARITLLIVIGLLGALSIGGFSLYQMANINNSVREMDENTLPSLIALSKAERWILRSRAPLLTSLLETDAEKRRVFETRFRETSGAAKEALRDYEKLVSDDKDRELLANEVRLVDAYIGHADRILAAAQAGQRDDALKLLAEARDTIDDMVKSFTAHMEYNEQLADVNAKLAEVAYDQARLLLAVSVLLLLALLGGLGFQTQRQVSRSLAEMVNSFTRIEKDLDFTVRLPAGGKDEIARVANAFNALAERLQQSFRQIAQQATALGTATERVSTASREMSMASRQQSESASSMAAAVEEMTVSVNHVADRADDSNRLATEAGKLASDGEKVINNTVGAINGIADSVRTASDQLTQLESQSEKISAIVSTIREIADQTNLLALNAAIEAARAGEQGRGFAVVADEVRKLAERTGLSTQEITDTIQQMVSGSQAAVGSIQSVEGAVQQGVGYAGQASEAMREIGTGSRNTVEVVSEITSAIREQGTASQEIAKQVERIAQMTDENSAAAQATSETAEELAAMARELTEIVARYRI
ncbi:methyl-accepting chemotaxis protein [Rhodocyclus tenuis]|uniref:methyl-accepting chemotaxis protein n=1 Tax=Rhodocyclus tenuis TaxID=1066 RepID=UPI001905BB30|nr:methyl-accepting chemotaxis protein [Rhodocyclus tenuis]MBK1681126.1 hypothetical protein [Rhodocyclus tenuis]